MIVYGVYGQTSSAPEEYRSVWVRLPWALLKLPQEESLLPEVLNHLKTALTSRIIERVLIQTASGWMSQLALL